MREQRLQWSRSKVRPVEKQQVPVASKGIQRPGPAVSSVTVSRGHLLQRSGVCLVACDTPD